MRDKAHYLDLFARADTVGAELLARAIYSARYFDPTEPKKFDADLAGEIRRPIDDDEMTSDEAIATLSGEQHWADALEDDPIPAWALDYALTRVADADGIRGKGQTWLADQVGVDGSTVRRWVSGRHPLEGPTAKLVRVVIKEAL